MSRKCTSGLTYSLSLMLVEASPVRGLRMVLLSKRALKVLVSTIELAGSSENASSVMTRDFCAARQSLLAPQCSSSSRLGRRTQRSNTEQPGEFVREMRLVATIRYLREKCLSLAQVARLA